MKTLADYPDLCAQIHPDLKGKIDPADYSYGSDKKLWWKCGVASDHIWECSVNQRARMGYGCPFCSGKRVSETNCLATLFPEIAKQWHPEKNGNLLPQNVSFGSSKKVWWKCPNGLDHEWEAKIGDRTKSGGCPFCNGKRVSITNNLATLFPEIAEQWHPTKNGALIPTEVTAGTHKRVWWKCPKGSDHEWATSVVTRTNSIKKGGCPFCLNQRVCSTNNLAYLYPELAKQWHPTKNEELKPSDIVAGAHKKVWWQCDIAKDHVWKAECASRVNRGDGCPFCAPAPRGASSTNNLVINNPEVAKKWHPTMNGDLKPSQVLSNSTKKYWWICDDGHYFQHSPSQMVSRNIKCPYCSGYRVGQGNSLLDKFPAVAAEWDYQKNGSMTPDKVSCGSNKKYWYICKLNHSFKSRTAERTRGIGCPKCTNQYSEPELRIYSEFKFLFPDTIHKHIIKKIELDVFVPSINLAIEFDGSYWHRNSAERDNRKNSFCKRMGIRLIRVRQSPLKKMERTDVIVPNKRFTKNDMDTLMRGVFFDAISIELSDARLRTYLEAKTFANDKLFEEYRTYLPLPHPEKSLKALRPDLSEYWDYEKNDPLTPEHFTPGSNRTMHWICRRGHSYQKTIVARRDAVGCPVCYKNRGQGRNKYRTMSDERQIDFFK